MSDFDISVDVSGVDGLIDRLSGLPDKLQRKGARAAARKAMNIVRNAARAGARGLDDPETKESIWRNITTQDSPRGGKRIGGVHMRVGVRGGARQYADTRQNRRRGRVGSSYATLGDKSNPGGDTWYWRFLELGTKRTPAHPFLLPALERRAQEVTTVLSTELWKQIEKLTPKA